MEFVINNPHPQQQFQNQGYSFPEYDTKKITLFYGKIYIPPSNDSDNNNVFLTPADGTLDISTNKLTTNGDPIQTAKYNSDGSFRFILINPIIIDKMADVFLDNFTALNLQNNAGTDSDNLEEYGLSLKIDQLNQNVYSNNTVVNKSCMIVLNNDEYQGSRENFVTSKSKKFNYLGVLQPGSYDEITGTLTYLNGGISGVNSGKTGLIRRTVVQDGSSDYHGIAFSIELVISNKK